MKLPKTVLLVLLSLLVSCATSAPYVPPQPTPEQIEKQRKKQEELKKMQEEARKLEKETDENLRKQLKGIKRSSGYTPPSSDLDDPWKEYYEKRRHEENLQQQRNIERELQEINRNLRFMNMTGERYPSYRSSYF